MQKHILVVDDSPTIRSSVSFCLRNAGYEVAVAADGQDALETLNTMRKEGTVPSLILTDINMPRMDGITFISKVKKTEFKFLPILVLTTESERDMIEKGKAAGASGWLIKPFHPEQLLWAIKKLMWTK
ncbi:MAG: response regulator [Desulfatibacillum sp.]|nr:response regulator [Desulfatibacillum sp.]